MKLCLYFAVAMVMVMASGHPTRRYYPGRGYLRSENSGLSRYRDVYEDDEGYRGRPARLRARYDDEEDDYYEPDAEPVRRVYRRRNSRRYGSRYQDDKPQGPSGSSSPGNGFNFNMGPNLGDLSKLGNGASFASGTAFTGGAGGASAAIGQAFSSGGVATGFGATIRSGDGGAGNGNGGGNGNGSGGSNGNYRYRDDIEREELNVRDADMMTEDEEADGGKSDEMMTEAVSNCSPQVFKTGRTVSWIMVCARPGGTVTTSREPHFVSAHVVSNQRNFENRKKRKAPASKFMANLIAKPTPAGQKE